MARPKWKEQSEAQGLHVDMDLQLGEIAHVMGNVYELTQVVGNLLFNAVEAMPHGGKITIETFSDNGSVMMRVTDTGTGMDEETRKKLFEPFFTTKETGQGLGTSIIYGIISRHSGEITVDSALGMGSIFTVRLPKCQETALTTEATERDATHPFTRARILLVDDDRDVRETNVEILAAGGHEIVSVADGRQAVAKCKKGNFDLVITDLSMPGMSGLELATELKKLYPTIPVILFSGWAMQEQEETVKEAGIDHIVVKPCLMEDLLEAVQTAVHTPVKT
jgi:CheY-like chemotaxis protein